MKGILLLLLLLPAAGFPLASAHPFTDETIPPRFSSAPVGTSEVIVVYSEAVDINHSVLEVFDGAGERVDKGDTAYYEGEHSLVVRTAPLEDGAYTVSSKVLSRVDGHLVSSAFVFGVGDVKVERPAGEQAITDLIFFPEAGARFPGLVGQTITLGAVMASMFVWGTQRKDLIGEDLAALEELFHKRFVSLVGLGLIIVFASNILMLGIQTLRLEASVLEALQTSFGTTWIIRMAVTAALLAVWFAMERHGRLSFRNQIPLLALSLVLIGTTTMLGHGMASEQPPAVILDYAHNLVAAVWIGGIIFFAFVLLPSLGGLGDSLRERISLAAIPRFSIMITIAVGAVIVSGPTLMWLLESDVGNIVESAYGKLIIAKILLAAAMIGMGAYHQFGIQKKAEKSITSGTIRVSGRLKRSLRAEAAMGIVLLGVVAMLTNGTLPEGEIQTVQAAEAEYGFTALEFADQSRFDIEIFPLASGANTLEVRVAGLAGEPPEDLDALKVKISNPLRNIAPITIPMERDGAVFRGDLTFGFSGLWQMELEAQKSRSANDGVALDLLIKPRLADLRAEIVEYEFPEKGAPLYPESDKRGNIWITDSSGPFLWKFSIAEEEFTKYEFDGTGSVTLKIDAEGRVWFTDIGTGSIGSLDPLTGTFEIIDLPDIEPAAEANYVITLDADAGGIWATIINKNSLVRYDLDTREFDVYDLPTADSGPFAVAIDPSGMVWFSQQAAGQIGRLDPGTGQILEFAPDPPLATPETITFDGDGNLWISEHQEGGGIARYSPALDSFERIRAPDDAAFPNSAVLDRYQNVWFMLHTVDKIASYDPHRGNLITIPVPTEESWIQFATSDELENIWFVEQKPSKLAVLKLTEAPAPQIVRQGTALQYTEIASPLVALGIVAASLFFVKAVQDKRRINHAVYGRG